jgi:hypothetical protein
VDLVSRREPTAAPKNVKPPTAEGALSINLKRPTRVDHSIIAVGLLWETWDEDMERFGQYYGVMGETWLGRMLDKSG